MADNRTDVERRQEYLRQKMDSSVLELQRRLMDEGGEGWHEALKKMLTYESSAEVLAQFSK